MSPVHMPLQLGPFQPDLFVPLRFNLRCSFNLGDLLFAPLPISVLLRSQSPGPSRSSRETAYYRGY